MRILLLTHAFNSLTQRLGAELQQRGHEVSIEFDIADSVAEEAVMLFRPELIVAPYLRRAIPESIWSRHVCLQVHPPAAIAAQLNGEPKTENWYIADTAPGAQLIVGLKKGVTRASFEKAIIEQDHSAMWTAITTPGLTRPAPKVAKKHCSYPSPYRFSPVNIRQAQLATNQQPITC